MYKDKLSLKYIFFKIYLKIFQVVSSHTTLLFDLEIRITVTSPQSRFVHESYIVVSFSKTRIKTLIGLICASDGHVPLCELGR